MNLLIVICITLFLFTFLTLAASGGSAMDAMARQPEVMSKLFTNMIVAAALIEGVALFAAVIAFLCI